MCTMETLKELETVKAAKKARTAVKSALTRVANQLKVSLVLKDEETKYDFAKLDKFSIKVDAEKLKSNLESLQNQNEAYGKVCKDELLKITDSNDEVFNQLDEETATYWSEARKEATSLLNLYNYEYSTALDRYLKNIDEEGKADIVPKTVNAAEVQKQKRKLENDLNRQLHRWNLRKTDWFAILEQTEQEIADSKEITKGSSVEENIRGTTKSSH